MKRRGFTLIELLVVIAIIAILAAILFPVFARARAKAQQANCLSNVKQLMLGIIMYVSDNDQKWFTYSAAQDGRIVTTGPGQNLSWAFSIFPYVKNSQIYLCPSGLPTNITQANCPPNGGISQYLFNGQITPNVPISMEAIAFPAECWAITDMAAIGQVQTAVNTATWPAAPWGGPRVGATHNNGENTGFLDGHAKWLNYMDQNWCGADGVLPATNTADPIATGKRHFWVGTD
ncbi:MAG TPA: prepilin-type N-terminal cleavage/methylation domain-containing protein [Armatimonadota bacterium]